MRKKILIIEPNCTAGVFLLNRAKRLNLETHIVTHERLFKHSYNEEVKKLIDYVHFTDFRDKEESISSIVQYGLDNKINGVLVGFEFVVDVAIEVARRLNLPTNTTEDIASLRDKFLMYSVFKEHDIPCAFTRNVRSWEEAQDAAREFVFPFIVKPVSNAGSCGVRKVNNLQELSEAFSAAQSMNVEFPHGIRLSTDVVFQDFLSGPECSVECSVNNGNISIIGITDKFTTNGNYFAEIGHIFPSNLEGAIQEKVRTVAHDVLKAFGITNGVAHIEMKITESGPKVVEVGARLAGDYIPNLILNASGIDCAALYINTALGECTKPVVKKKSYSGIYFIHSEEKGVFKSIKNDLSLYGQVDIFVDAGDTVNDAVDNINRIGKVVITKNSYEEVVSTVDTLKKNLEVVLIKGGV